MYAQNKRAIDARRWRASATERRRFSKVLEAYIQTKHDDIYQQVKRMYDNLNEKYPTKHDLTKTREWKTWVSTCTKEWKTWKKNAHAPDTSDESSDEETIMIQPEATTVVETTTTAETTTETAVETTMIQPEATTGVETTTTAETTTETVVETTMIQAEATTVVETTTTAETTAETAVETTTATATESAIEMEEHISENELLEQPINEIIQEMHQDEDLENYLNNDDYVRGDNIINEIIQELQQDEELRNYLNNDDYVQPHYADEDEGIDLNVELELEEIIEPLDLEEEGFFF